MYVPTSKCLGTLYQSNAFYNLDVLHLNEKPSGVSAEEEKVKDLAFVKTTLLEIDATASTIGEIDVKRMFEEIVGSSPALQVVWSRVRK